MSGGSLRAAAEQPSETSLAAADESLQDSPVTAEESPQEIVEVHSPIAAYLESLVEKFRGVREGAVADYIPELAKANPDWFGICVATTDGHVYQVGDARVPFTIQSISKPLTYGLALEDNGRQAVLEKIGVEPTGDAFNSISLAPETGCPLNPMINAGAIAATSLVAGYSQEDKLERLLGTYSLYAGRPLTIDEDVYASERDTGHRNRAIGHMLRNFGILEGDPELPLDLYFRQCSIELDCRDLSLIAATLANGGENPLTGERAISAKYVESVLSLMTTCGMYDSAGEWAYWVGLPAKSGVGGGVLAVLPGQLGIGVFSPPLDAKGNSVRGVLACQEMSRDFNLHFLRVARSSRSIVRAEYGLSSVSSKRVRSRAERAALDEVGARVRVFELQGDIGFSAMETLLQKMVTASDSIDHAVVDFKRVTLIDPSSARLLIDLVVRFGAANKTVLLVNARHQSRFLRTLEEELVTPESQAYYGTFQDLDPAIEYCENRLLEQHSGVPARAPEVELAEHALCHGLSAAEVAHLESLVEERSYVAGQSIVQKGQTAAEVFFVMSGEVSVMIDVARGLQKRLSTVSAGMAFGELALVERAVRSADVRADRAVRCLVLTADDFDELGKTQPQIQVALLRNLLSNLAQMVSRLNQEVATLSD